MYVVAQLKALPLLRAAIALALVISCVCVRANTFCVSNSDQLQEALLAASNISVGTSNEIDIVRGTYDTSSSAFSYNSTSSANLLIEGGFEPGCMSAHIVDAAATILNGHGVTNVLSIDSEGGSIHIHDLTIENGQGPGPGAGLRVNYSATSKGSVTLPEVIIKNNHSTGDVGGLYISAGFHGPFVSEALELIDSLITDNSAGGQYAAGYLIVDSQSSYTVVGNNTIAANVSSANSSPVGGMFIGGLGTWTLAKNIFWNNSGFDLQLDNSQVSLLDNNYGSLSGVAPFSDQGHRSVDPRFVDPAGANFHLAGDSPMIAASNFLYDSGYDLEGHSVPYAGRMDLGAFFETVFVDNFDD